MPLFCRLCGTRTDGVERLGVYCPGERCGTDLRAGLGAAVQAWCEPARRLGEAGRTVAVHLVVRNAGTVSTGYHVEPVEPVEGRLDYDRSAVAAPLAPGQTRQVELRHTLPFDRIGAGLDIASLFGVPGADLAGQVQGARSERFGVALRVVATSGGLGAACAAFAVDVPGRIDLDLDLDGAPDGDRGNRQDRPDGSGGSDGPGSSARPGAGGGRPRPGPHQPPGWSPAHQPTRPARRSGGCGPLAVVLIVLLVLAVLAAVLLGLGRRSDGDSSGRPAPTASAAPSPTAEPSTVRPTTGSTKPAPSPTRTRPTTSPATSPAATTVAVPNLVGLDQEAAAQKLLALGLAVDGDYVESNGVPELQIISTEPKAGAKVAPGSKVFLHISDGRATVPDVAGKTQAQAEQALRDHHFTNITVSTEPSTSTAAGLATRTDPVKGRSVGLKTPITLWIAYRPTPL
ncbi:PASTA domain-containing protein [Kitasatospora sp. NPDC090091]|uniref:PASTA domain-containing protein n=1 Tax=Kitasatospora sp. NPDC090091 TaxID=3364081 RepID=UPI003829898E